MSEVAVAVKEALGLDDGVLSFHEISRNCEEALGLYPRRGMRARRKLVGGICNRAYELYCVTLLLRWGRDGLRAEAKAKEIYDVLANCKFDGGFVSAVYAAPVWLGADGRGVFEYALDFDFYFDVSAFGK